MNREAEVIVAYHSTTAKAGREWIAYIDLGADYLGIRFHGSTEGEAMKKAADFWEKDRAEREETRARIEAGREKSAAMRAAKAATA